jgi:DNA polymerase III sliding clamp (beta) subunit (PCNA family)
MKIGNFEIEQMAAKKDVRYYLNECAHVQELNGAMVACATDGHALAIVPVEMEDGDVPGYVTAEALKKARKAGSVKCNGAYEFPDGSTMPRRSELNDASFPDVSRVIPREEDLSSVELTFNADLLHRLARAITENGKHGRVITLRFRKENASTMSMRVDGDNGAFGVIMPVRKR